MKLRCLLLVVLLLVVLPLSAQATGNGGNGRDKANQKLNSLWDDLINSEIKYHTLHGKYFQGVRTHNKNNTPANGNELDPNNLDDHPTDQATSWNGFKSLAKLPMAMEIHGYDGPAGRGFVIIMEVTDDSILYRRAINAGPEDWRSHDWQKVNETPW